MAGLSQRSEDSMWWKVCWDMTKGGKEMLRKEKTSEPGETKKKHLKVLYPHPWGVHSERKAAAPSQHPSAGLYERVRELKDDCCTSTLQVCHL